MEEYKIARMFRDSRILTIGGGSSEIMREILAKMIIDDKQYKNDGLSLSYAKNPAAESKADEAKQEIKSPNTTSMSYETIFSALSERAGKRPALGSTLKFDFGDRHILIDGKGAANVVSGDNTDADCTVTVSEENLLALMKGELNPMGAFMGGKIKVKGDMSVAMKLQSLFS
jgi:putative sterol carrier protein